MQKATKEKGSGLLHLGEKERIYWIEYSCIVKVGIDLSKVTMLIECDNITITLPRAQILAYNVEDITEENYMISKDSWVNANPITAEDQILCMRQAEYDMKAKIENDDEILLRARERAIILIENYIVKLGEASGVFYSISWNS